MKVMKLVMVNVITLFLVSSGAHASDEAKAKLLNAIKGGPKCDDKAATALLKETQADEEIFYEAVKNGCEEFAGSAFKSTPGDQVAAAAKRYLEHIGSDILPRAKSNVQGGAPAFHGMSADKIAFGVGFLQGAAKYSCDPKTTNENLCALASKADAAMKEIEGLSTSDPRKRCEMGDTHVCELILNEAMKGKNGVTRLDDWYNGATHTQESAYWKLNQIVGGNAMFVYLDGDGRDFVIGVRQASIKKKLMPGNPLTWYAACLKFLKETTGTNARGFAVKVKLYDALECSSKVKE